MATFKTVKNTRSKKQYFYIDNKRVSQDKYDNKYYAYRIQGRLLLSLWTCIDDKAGFIRSGFCFD